MSTSAEHKPIALWLFSICAVIFCMVVVGGLTRLTGSGLSMVEWAPITGWLPPMTAEQWQAVFELYQATPQFSKVNAGMDLAGFKSIFWLEFIHRLLGRVIGLLFLLPMLWFLWRIPMTAALRWKLVGLFVLGGLQGVLGWYMVKSGLVNDPKVSQYRLTAHLGLALIIYASVLWVALGLWFTDLQERYPPSRHWVWSSVALALLVFVTILAGGFVAGTHAGYAFNTFPLMHGQLIPEDYGALSPWWINSFENVAAVQFNHRLLATVTLMLALGLVWRGFTAYLSVRFLAALTVLILVITVQYLLGIATLLLVVPISLASSHQAVAVLVLTAAIITARFALDSRR